MKNTTNRNSLKPIKVVLFYGQGSAQHARKVNNSPNSFYF